MKKYFSRLNDVTYITNDIDDGLMFTIGKQELLDITLFTINILSDKKYKNVEEIIKKICANRNITQQKR